MALRISGIRRLKGSTKRHLIYLQVRFYNLDNQKPILLVRFFVAHKLFYWSFFHLSVLCLFMSKFLSKFWVFWVILGRGLTASSQAAIHSVRVHLSCDLTERPPVLLVPESWPFPTQHLLVIYVTGSVLVRIYAWRWEVMPFSAGIVPMLPMIYRPGNLRMMGHKLRLLLHHM